MTAKTQVVVSGGFDNISSSVLRLLEEASKLGGVTVLLWSDDVIAKIAGKPPKFPLSERHYFLDSIRYVSRVEQLDNLQFTDALPEDFRCQIWADVAHTLNEKRATFCAERQMAYRVFTSEELSGFPEPPAMPSAPGRKKVVATGCYDWFHSGHVRFAEEASTYGDLYLCIGNDANVRLLKGEGHPLLRAEERGYVAGAVKYVKQALITSGSGWLDADPEIRRLKPDIYVVNEDGDKGGKREYCDNLGMQYVVLKRAPAPGLPRRTSTDLRGF